MRERLPVVPNVTLSVVVTVLVKPKIVWLVLFNANVAPEAFAKVIVLFGDKTLFAPANKVPAFTVVVPA